MPEIPERARAAIADSVRCALVQAGYTFPDEEPTPAHTIPVRCWFTPTVSAVGYLDLFATEEDGETVSYEMAFRASPLADGEKPRYELRFEFEDGDRG